MRTENIAACRKWVFACAMIVNAAWSCAAEPCAFALSYRQPALAPWCGLRAARYTEPAVAAGLLTGKRGIV